MSTHAKTEVAGDTSGYTAFAEKLKQKKNEAPANDQSPKESGYANFAKRLKDKKSNNTKTSPSDSSTNNKQSSGGFAALAQKLKQKKKISSNVQVTGKNYFYLSNGEKYEYNNLKFDKKEVELYAPLEVAKGWYCERNKFKNSDQYLSDLNSAIEAWEAEKNDPKSKLKKPCLDRHTVAQIDTEFNFFEQPIDLITEVENLFCAEDRDHHTTQIKLFPANKPAPNLIFASKNFSGIINPLLEEKGYQPLPILSERDCDLFDYLRIVTDSTWEVETNAPDGYVKTLPKYFISLAAHNAEAEINLIFHGYLKRRILALQDQFCIEEGIERRSKVLRAFSTIIKKGNKESVDWVSLKAIVKIDGEPFHLCLRIIDTIKCHGVRSLGDFAKASGYKLDAKDLLNRKDKADIKNTFRRKTEDSIAYSLGDTCNLEILYSFYEKLKKVYGTWELENYTQPPTLTIGRTVVDLDFAIIANSLGFESD